MAKNASGAAFLQSKKRHEERLRQREMGMDVDFKDEDVFELQHHHLLNCLEKTTVSFIKNIYILFVRLGIFSGVVNIHIYIRKC